MAAGLGFKDFVTGEVLTAADVDGYLMQGVWVFASAAARDAAVTSPQEGNFAYLKDTNVTTYYTGSAWANLDTTGMTNPMTTTGDTIYSSSGSTPARLGIGSTGQVLTVAGGVPSWAAPAGGGKVLAVVQASTSTEKTTSSTTFTDTNLTITYTPTLATSKILVFVSQNGCYKSEGDAQNAITLKLMRDATDLITFGHGMLWTNTALKLLTSTASVVYLDSPATTSSITYKTQFKNVNASASVACQLVFSTGVTSTITLMEIGA
jgi:hypothetical protein